MLRFSRPTFCALLLAFTSVIAAGQYTDKSLEISLERYQPVAPAANANFTGLSLNYFLGPHFYLGTNQSSLYLRGTSEYRPDVHMGFLLPVTDWLAVDTAAGVDFFTGLIIALAVIGEDDSLNYQFRTDFYAPYVNFSGGLRFAMDAFALRLMTQTQFGGYLQSDTTAFNISLWLGLGVSYRISL